MGATFMLVLDTTAPANPVALLNHGEPVTGTPVVALSASSPSTDVTEMKVWGDLDMPGDPRFGTLETDSEWIVWIADLYLVLTGTQGVKRVNVRLRDDCGNETLVFGASITLNLDTPVVAITVPPDTARISRNPGHDTCIFTFEVSHDIDRWEVRVVQSAGAAALSGILIQGVDGSVVAGEEIQVTLDGTDVQTKAPGDGPKIVKVFAHSATFGWSS